VAPIDRAKILIQTQQYANIRECIRELPKDERFPWSLWRGNGVNVIRYFPTQALTFAFKDLYKPLLTGSATQGTHLKFYLLNVLSGGLAGGTATLFVYPLDLARTRLTGDKALSDKQRQFRGFFDCIFKTYNREGGIKALYKGFTISVVTITLYRGLFFGGFDTLKAHFTTPNSSFFVLWAIGQTNTVFAQLVLYPLDTLRRNMMMHRDKQISARECAAEIWKSHGITGFFKGVIANSFRATGGALCLAFYETFQRKIYG